MKMRKSQKQLIKILPLIGALASVAIGRIPKKIFPKWVIALRSKNPLDPNFLIKNQTQFFIK